MSRLAPLDKALVLILVPVFYSIYHRLTHGPEPCAVEPVAPPRPVLETIEVDPPAGALAEWPADSTLAERN